MPKKILVVDDDESIRELLMKSLESRGYAMVCAVDGVQGLEKLKSERPDLLITDINMPRMDGIELLKRVRADEELKEMPVIMLTAQTSDEEIITGLSSGADHYITKPFTIAQVVMGIQMMFDEK